MYKLLNSVTDSTTGELVQISNGGVYVVTCNNGAAFDSGTLQIHIHDENKVKQTPDTTNLSKTAEFAPFQVVLPSNCFVSADLSSVAAASANLSVSIDKAY